MTANHNAGNEAFAARLRQQRMQKGYSQRAFTKMIGLNYTQYNRYENGETLPAAETLSKLAEALEVSVDYLLEGKEEAAAVAKLQDQELLKIFTDIEKLPPEKKSAVKSILESVVRDTKHQQIAV